MSNSMNATLNENEKLDNLLHHLLMLHNNESSTIKDEQTIKDFDTLLIELTKVKYNIRYCSNQNCSCHPESTIKAILRNVVLTNFIKNYSYLEEKDISKIIDLENYKHTTIFD